MAKKLKTVIVGCGNIATAYAEQIKTYANVELVGFSDLDPARAKEFARIHGGRAFVSLDEALAEPGVELIVNLTIHHAHVPVITKCLLAGKHVHTEKPLALTYAEAKKLVALAKRKNLRLSSAPSTFLGEAAQTCGKVIRQRKPGPIRVSYAEINHGRIEVWHPNPAPFYEVGPVWDVAVYPLGVWAAFCGPMRKVTAVGKTLLPARRTKDGKPFRVATPDYFTALIEFENGMLGRLTSNFYVSTTHQKNGMMEFHGDTGSVYLANCFSFDASVEFAPFGADYKAVQHVRAGFKGTEFARGVQDLADAILKKRPHRCDGQMAAHVVEAIEAIHKSARTGKSVALRSTFPAPKPMPWAG